MVDTRDLKSLAGNRVPVRVRSPAPRQKNSAPFRFRGLRKSRENCTSAASFFLSETGVSRGTPVSVISDGSDLDCPGAPKQRPQTGALFWYSPVQARTGGSIRETPKMQAQRGIFGKSNGCRERSESQSGHRHHVRRTQLRSVSAVCLRAAKTAHPLRPSSIPKRRSHGGPPFRL